MKLDIVMLISEHNVQVLTVPGFISVERFGIRYHSKGFLCLTIVLI